MTPYDFSRNPAPTGTLLRPGVRPDDDAISYCSRLPKRRWTTEAKGLILEFPRTGMIGVPHRRYSDGSWDVVVLRPDRDGLSPRGAYDVSVSELEIETAIEHCIGSEINVDDRQSESQPLAVARAVV